MISVCLCVVIIWICDTRWQILYIISIKNVKETSDDWSDGSNVYPQQTTSEEQVKSIDDQNLILQRYENSWTDVENESDSSDNNENY